LKEFGEKYLQWIEMCLTEEATPEEGAEMRFIPQTKKPVTENRQLNRILLYRFIIFENLNL
jgi:hypothetical protein